MFKLVKPCDNCPFLKNGGIRLTADRTEEIAANMLSLAGGSFWCHKTTEPDEDGGSGPDADHCAGALIFAEKNGVATQAMRIAERLGLYKPEALMANTEVVQSVFDSFEEMCETSLD